MTKIILIGDGPLFNHCVKKILSKNKKILLITSKKNKKFLELNKKLFIDFKYLEKIKKIKFLISIMNGKIINKNILDKTEIAINFHDGPLPKYGGLFSSTWAILNNEKKHGCCWHLMTTKIDTGNILSFKNFNIDKSDTAYSVDLKSLYFGYKIFEKKILKIIRVNKVSFSINNSELKSYYGKKDIANIPNHGLLDLKKNLSKSLLIFRALKVSNEKKNKIFQPKISTTQGIKKVKSFIQIKCKNSKSIQSLNEKIRIKNNSFSFRVSNKCYEIELERQYNKFIYLR